MYDTYGSAGPSSGFGGGYGGGSGFGGGGGRGAAVDFSDIFGSAFGGGRLTVWWRGGSKKSTNGWAKQRNGNYRNVYDSPKGWS